MHQASIRCTRDRRHCGDKVNDNNVWHVSVLTAQQIYATSCEHELHFLAVPVAEAEAGLAAYRFGNNFSGTCFNDHGLGVRTTHTELAAMLLRAIAPRLITYTVVVGRIAVFLTAQEVFTLPIGGVRHDHRQACLVWA